MLTTKHYSAICATNRGLLVAGGGTRLNPDTATRNCDLLDYSTLRWTRYPDTLSNVYGAGAVCIQEVVYLTGGYKGREKTLESLNLERKEWIKQPDMPQGVRFPIVTSVDHLILILLNTASVKNYFQPTFRITLQCYNTTSKHWQFKSSLPSAVTCTNGAQAVSVDQKMFVVGASEILCLVYDLQLDSWSILSQPMEDHFYGSTVNIDGKIVVLGGLHNRENSATIEEYDPESGKWQVSSTKLPVAMYCHFCCLLK